MEYALILKMIQVLYIITFSISWKLNFEVFQILFIIAFLISGRRNCKMRILFSEYQEKRSEREKKRAKRVATSNGGEKLERKFTVKKKKSVRDIF